jgi:hypothetical protein
MRNALTDNPPTVGSILKINPMLTTPNCSHQALRSRRIFKLAHLESYCMEKNGLSAYSWIRVADENSNDPGHRRCAHIEQLRSTVKTDDIEALDHRRVTNEDWINFGAQILLDLPSRPRRVTGANKGCPAMTSMSRCKMLHSWKAKKMAGVPSCRAWRPEGRQPSV